MQIASNPKRLPRLLNEADVEAWADDYIVFDNREVPDHDAGANDRPGMHTSRGCHLGGRVNRHSTSRYQEYHEQSHPQRAQEVPVEGNGVHRFAARGAAQHHHEQRDQASDQVRGVESREHVHHPDGDRGLSSCEARNPAPRQAVTTSRRAAAGCEPRP